MRVRIAARAYDARATAPSMPRRLCGARAASIALTATSRPPSVPFLKPTAIDRPDAISRWVWLSVVRAPIAVQATAVRQVLRHNRIEHLGRGGQAQLGQLTSSSERAIWSPRCASQLSVEVRVVDEPLPADRRARLLEVDAHADEQPVAQALTDRQEALCVLERGGRIVNRTWTHDHEHAAVAPGDDGLDLAPRGADERGAPRDSGCSRLEALAVDSDVTSALDCTGCSVDP